MLSVTQQKYIDGLTEPSEAIYLGDGGFSRIGLRRFRFGDEIRFAVGLYLEPNQETLDKWNNLNSRSLLNKNPNPKKTHELY